MPEKPQLRVLAAPRDAADAGERLSIVVAVLTFRRPDLLADFLAAYARIALPDGCDVTLLVVDNDAAGSGRPTFEAWCDRIPGARYVVEPRTGIPVARNRALDEAIAADADALCFIDDDEVPETDWLVRLVEAWRCSGAQLVGGPVGVAAPPKDATLWQRLMNSSLAARADRKFRLTAQSADRGGRYTIVTNNWLCDLRWLQSKGLRFDENLLMTGGSDTAFCRAAVAAGCKKAWASDAVVHETIPADRLTARYQLHRGASQSITHFRMKHDRVTPPVMLVTVAMAAARAVLGVVLLAIPVYGVGSLAMAIRSLGWSIGRIQAIRGLQSTLYVPTATVEADDRGRILELAQQPSRAVSRAA